MDISEIIIDINFQSESSEYPVKSQTKSLAMSTHVKSKTPFMFILKDHINIFINLLSRNLQFSRNYMIIYEFILTSYKSEKKLFYSFSLFAFILFKKNSYCTFNKKLLIIFNLFNFTLFLFKSHLNNRRMK